MKTLRKLHSVVDAKHINLIKLHKDSFDKKWYCGYIKIEKDSPLYSKHYDDKVFSSIIVHGGLTYSGAINEDGDFYIGFDCNHLGDNVDYCNLEYVSEQIKSLSIQISKLENDLNCQS